MASNVVNNLNSLFKSINYYSFTIFGNVMMVVGTVATFLGIIVFSHKTMRQNAGCIYYIAYYLANGLTLYTSLFAAILSFFNIDPSYNNVAYCKISFYLRISLGLIATYILVLASIDRALITSSKASIRQRSTHRLAYCSIFGVTLFFLLFYFYLLIIANIYWLTPNYRLCYLPPDSSRVISYVATVLFDGIIPSFLLVVTGITTVRNLRKGRVQPIDAASNGNNDRRSKDRHLFLILLIEIIGYAPLAIITNAYGIYREATQYQMKSNDSQAIEYFLSSFPVLLRAMPKCLNFYIYLILLKSFRRKTFKILPYFWRQH
ncbi:unnamed protein product [Adineta ricciae]|uniref:G-protein coupled receptors family 1 profile domain-containing protein n=1 Tax=Adineta ricciae TaxID=249248 RepID=A0A814E1I5_ADIRI|nr:unnamed protein product [Adineta ricciae]CAF1477631.1 unnamed protein product [Adineta ricciae]